MDLLFQYYLLVGFSYFFNRFIKSYVNWDMSIFMSSP